MIRPEKELLITTLELGTFLLNNSKARWMMFSTVQALNAVRFCLKSRDDWKINFRDLQEGMYTGLWKPLLRIEKVDEALFAAEQGRVQTLPDNLLIQ